VWALAVVVVQALDGVQVLYLVEVVAAMVGQLVLHKYWRLRWGLP